MKTLTVHLSFQGLICIESKGEREEIESERETETGRGRERDGGTEREGERS